MSDMDIYVGPNTLEHFSKKYLGDPDNIKSLGDGTVTGAIKTLNDSLASQNSSIKSCNDRINGLNDTVSKVINEDLAKIGSGATVVGHAKVADQAVAVYNGQGSTICVSLSSNQVQFRWTNNQIEVFVDKTRIGYMTTH